MHVKINRFNYVSPSPSMVQTQSPTHSNPFDVTPHFSQFPIFQLVVRPSTHTLPMEESVSAELLHDTAVSDEPPSQFASNGAHLTPEELVAKAIAPVKREFLRPPPLRSSSTNVKDAASSAKNDGDDKAAPSSLVKEKKSKRQLKRERRQVTSNSYRSVFL